MPESPSSYQPHAMAGGLAGELRRLDAQAALAWPEEARLLQDAGLADGARVVDVGCGPGHLLRRLRDLLPDAQLVGVDHDAELLACAGDICPDAELLRGSALALPLPSAAVDFAVARYVLQHLVEPVTGARELRRILRPGGSAAVIDVDGGLWGIVEPHQPELAEIQARAWAAPDASGADRAIGRRLWRIMRDAGFEDVCLRPFAYHSDALGLDAFEPLIGPENLLPRVLDGTLMPLDYRRAADGYRRFREDPAAFVLLVGLMVTGRVGDVA